MSAEQVLDFTVADLLAGGDDVVLLSTATNGPDGLWDEVVGWSRARLAAALVAAVGVIQSDGPPATAAGDTTATIGTRPETGRPATRGGYRPDDR